MKTQTYTQYIASILIIALSLNHNILNAQQLEEYFIINDTSLSSNCQLDAKSLFQKLILNFELQQYPNKGVVFKTSTCGESRVPNVASAELTVGENSFFGNPPNKRKQELYCFLVQAKTNVAALSEHSCSENQTNLIRTITYLSQFYTKSAQKTLLIFSDMAECSSVFNAQRYQDYPSRLLSDYNSIVELFEKDNALPDLTDVKVIIINPMDSDYLLYLSRFWTRLFKDLGSIEVTVRTAF